MYLLTITILNTFRAKPLLSSLGSLYGYRNTKWNMVPSSTVATLCHLYTTDFRHPTNTMNYSIPIATFYSTCMSSLLEIVSAVLPADTLADAASFCLGQTGSTQAILHG